jgi:putative endonuclease
MAYIRESVLNTRQIGNLGEDIACTWLKKQGYLIVERNYLKKWGEIDIVAAKDKIVHFIEVKSVFVQESNRKGERRPEENVHELKVRRLKRVIQSYLLERKLGLAAEFKFHILTVHMNSVTHRARVNFLENIVL